MTIRPATSGDAVGIAEIYNHYIVNTIVTFEDNPVDANEMARRIERTTEDYPWLVAESDGQLIGYAYAVRWKSRAAYRHSVELTIYLRDGSNGRGWGSQLYQALINEVKQLDVHCIIGGVALPNPASVALHEKLGFEKVAHFREVGHKHDRWIDVAYWQLAPDD